MVVTCLVINSSRANHWSNITRKNEFPISSSLMQSRKIIRQSDVLVPDDHSSLISLVTTSLSNDKYNSFEATWHFNFKWRRKLPLDICLLDSWKILSYELIRSWGGSCSNVESIGTSQSFWPDAWRYFRAFQRMRIKSNCKVCLASTLLYVWYYSRLYQISRLNLLLSLSSLLRTISFSVLMMV